jgi:PPOX class probable F420-dependent enzyme
LQQVGLAVKRLQWRHHREANRRLSSLGLSLVQWDVLRHLHGNPGASLHKLAELTFQTDQSMGELARRMVDRGLIARVEGPGRQVRHELTPAGDDVRLAGAEAVDGVLADSLGHLTEPDRETLHRLLLKAAGTRPASWSAGDPGRAPRLDSGESVPVTPAELFASVPVARLATVDATGAPHLVPIVFAVTGDVIHTAVDGKPKRSRRLKRLANIAANPRVSVLADHYEPDWSRLWWVRADGVARVLDESPSALAALTARYPQYVDTPPPGPFVEITVDRWSAWTP